MNISAINNTTSFGALLGRKEVTYHHGSGIDSMITVQHIYPFKDEFKSCEELDRALTQFKRSDFFKEQNSPDEKTNTNRVYKIALEGTLPFTEKEFINTLKYPQAYYASKAAAAFIKSKEYATTTVKHTGYIPANIVNEGKLNVIR